MADKEHTLEIIHELVQICKDGETGYAHAAGIVQAPGLKPYFKEESLERSRFVQELTEMAQHLGENPEASGSVAGTLHRVWIAAKADIGLGDQSVLNSVEQGEDAAKKAYEKALSAELLPEARSLVQRQAKSIFTAHDYVRDLRDKKTAAESTREDKVA